MAGNKKYRRPTTTIHEYCLKIIKVYILIRKNRTSTYLFLFTYIFLEIFVCGNVVNPKKNIANGVPDFVLVRAL